MLLGLDIGSSSVKASLLREDRTIGRVARIEFPTSFDGLRVEVNPASILNAIQRAIAELGPRVRKIDAIAFSVMSPAWVAMGRRGRPITPIVTHQDRRSVVEAIEIEQRIGKARHLSIAGVRPIPGGISSTTFAWFAKHHPSLLKRAELVGHLNTFLIRHLTGKRVVDPANATFMGIFSTRDQSGWSEELRENISLPKHLLPDILESNKITGTVIPSSAAAFGLPPGVPVLAGMIDTSAAMLFAGAKPGQLLNTCGSTDVLALCTDRFRPHEHLITRAFGIGKKWMSVSTLAAAGSAIAWTKEQFFADYSWPQFDRLVKSLVKKRAPTTICFDPHLAGDRMSIEQPTAAFSGLTLSTTRFDMLAAILDALAVASAARLPLLASRGVKIHRRVIVTGRGFDEVLRRDWKGRWSFERAEEASLRGLGILAVSSEPKIRFGSS